MVLRGVTSRIHLQRFTFHLFGSGLLANFRPALRSLSLGTLRQLADKGAFSIIAFGAVVSRPPGRSFQPSILSR